MKSLPPQPFLILSNCEEHDMTFDSDRGSWNVSRAQRDVQAGKHKLWGFDTASLFDAIQNVEVDQNKVKDLASSLKKLIKTPPIILVVEDGKVWVIDGHHRIHAHKRRNLERMSGFVIEEQDNARYIIWYNGQRLPPWHDK